VSAFNSTKLSTLDNLLGTNGHRVEPEEGEGLSDKTLTPTGSGMLRAG
jgi:hypothetical protein